MSVSSLESFLARIYVDAQSRERFLSNPEAEALSAGLSEDEIEAVKPEDEIEAVKQIDRVGLELFAASLERKRNANMSAARPQRSTKCSND